METRLPNKKTLTQPKKLQRNGKCKNDRKLTKYDPAKALVDDEEIAFFITDALETKDSVYIANALGIVARGKGVYEIAKETGLSADFICSTLNAHGSQTLETAKLVLNSAKARTALFEQARKMHNKNEINIRENVSA